MKILFAPLICAFETGGPMQRVATLAQTFLRAGHEAAFCSSENCNYRPVEGVKNFPCPLPEPMGLPRPLGKIAAYIAFKSGIMKSAEVRSFEQVHKLIGNLNPSYFFNDVEVLRRTIREFKPDVVYSEFRLSAIVAAKQEGVKLVGTCSIPALSSYRSNPEYSTAVRQKLKSMNLPELDSILDLFHWQSVSFIANSPSLEPIEMENAVYVGPFFDIPEPPEKTERNKIVVYLGNGSISPKLALREIRRLAAECKYEIYLASEALHPTDEANLHIDRKYDFSKLLPESALFIHHGGQNSCMSGLLSGTPQLIFPGKVFERHFNAESIDKAGAGLLAPETDFNTKKIKDYLERLVNDENFSKIARELGKEQRKLGGAAKTLSVTEGII
jgi:UDP:flavonoid glycosyltransferase YjiC (YdhE family)